MCERGNGMWLGWLDRNGQLDPVVHPSDRVTRELIKAFVTEYSTGRAEGTVAGAIRGIAYVLWACAPPDGVGWLTRPAHRTTKPAQASRPQLQTRLRLAEPALPPDRPVAPVWQNVGSATHRTA